jgi:hypothetical protein
MESTIASWCGSQWLHVGAFERKMAYRGVFHQAGALPVASVAGVKTFRLWIAGSRPTGYTAVRIIGSCMG